MGAEKHPRGTRREFRRLPVFINLAAGANVRRRETPLQEKVPVGWTPDTARSFPGKENGKSSLMAPTENASKGDSTCAPSLVPPASDRASSTLGDCKLTPTPPSCLHGASPLAGPGGLHTSTGATDPPGQLPMLGSSVGALASTAGGEPTQWTEAACSRKPSQLDLDLWAVGSQAAPQEPTCSCCGPVEGTAGNSSCLLRRVHAEPGSVT